MNHIIFTPWRRNPPSVYPTIPTRYNGNAAGIDLFAFREVTIDPMKRALIETGWEVILPTGTYGQLCDTSGMAAQLGLHVMAGIIDSDYEGQIMVLVVNLSDKQANIPAGGKIAQMIVQKYHSGSPMVMTATVKNGLHVTSDRGSRGFGFAESHLALLNQQDARCLPHAIQQKEDLQIGQDTQTDKAPDKGALATGTCAADQGVQARFERIEPTRHSTRFGPAGLTQPAKQK